MGPTASGKTALSVELAKKLQTEIVSADSRQFYRKMDIGTAKPSKEELNAVPHHFIDFLEPDEDYNIGKYEIDALKKISELHSKFDNVILTGGSGLYIRAITNGLDDLPPSDPELRLKLEKELEVFGVFYLAEKLKVLDPIYYSQVDKKNPHRIIRALEVSLQTGVPYSSLRTNVSRAREFNIRKYALLVDRETLYDRINRRVTAMFNAGLVEEVRSLIPFRKCNALQTVGYAEIFDYLDGKISLAQAEEEICKNTRHYAKRQMTWLRKETDVNWIENIDEISVSDD